MYGALGRTYPLCPLPTPPSVRYLSFLPCSQTFFPLERYPLSKIDKDLGDVEIDRWGLNQRVSGSGPVGI